MSYCFIMHLNFLEMYMILRFMAIIPH